MKGGDNYQFSVPGFGLIYPINALFLILGLVYLIKVRTRETRLILIWIALAPVASSMTREAPHALRFITVLPVPMMLSSLGFVSLAKKVTTKWVAYALYGAILILCFGRYWLTYVTGYRVGFSESWQYGYKEVVGYANENYDDYDKIILTKRYGEPHEFVLFYGADGSTALSPWDPESYRKDTNLVRFFQSNWFWVDSFDKYYFVNDWQILAGAEEQMFRFESGIQVDCKDQKCLLVASPDYEIRNWTKIEEIDFLDGKPAFLIYK